MRTQLFQSAHEENFNTILPQLNDRINLDEI